MDALWSEILEAIAPAIIALAGIMVSLLMYWLRTVLPAALHTYIEKNHREAFEKAMMTGLRNALDQDPNTSPKEAIDMALVHVQASAGDAIKFFGPQMTGAVMRRIGHRVLGQIKEPFQKARAG